MSVQSLPWYYTQQIGKAGDTIALAGDEWHHCHHVLRMKPGDQLILTNGKGSCFESLITGVSEKEGLILLEKDVSSVFPHGRSYKISIGIAPTKNIDRIEFAVEKLVEIGIDEIAFLQCKHNERSRIRIDRFEKIILAASKQSKKIFFPELHDLMTPEMLIKRKKIENAASAILCCHLDETSRSLFENYPAGSDVMVLVGPEGGFAPEEITLMKKMGAAITKLGPHRLRVETAAITACNGIHLINEMKSIT